jgi:hypothetical protein
MEEVIDCTGIVSYWEFEILVVLVLLLEELEKMVQFV